MQVEIIEDQYPLLLVNGQRIVYELLKCVGEDGDIEKGEKQISAIKLKLDEIDSDYDALVMSRRPEEILYL